MSRQCTQPAHILLRINFKDKCKETTSCVWYIQLTHNTGTIALKEREKSNFTLLRNSLQYVLYISMHGNARSGAINSTRK